MNSHTHSFIAGMIAGTLIVALIISIGLIVLQDKSEAEPIAPSEAPAQIVTRRDLNPNGVFAFYEIKHADGSRCFVYHGSGGWEPTMHCRIEPNKAEAESVVPSEGDQLK